MKIRNKIFHSLRSISIIGVFVAGIITIIASGGNGDSVPNPYNVLLSGDYQLLSVEFEWDHMNIRSGDVVADGQGTLTYGGGTIAYSITAERLISISVPSDSSVETEYGIVASDGSLAVITDAQLDDPNDQRDVETHLVVKKSTNMTMDRVSGEFIISQIGQNASGYYTSRVLVVLENDTSGTWEILDHTQPAEVGLNGNLSYVVAADGTFSVNNGASPTDDTGIIAPDANMFVMIDADTTDADNEIIFAIGVRKSASAPVFSSDNYQLHFIGNDYSNFYPYGPQFAARWNAVEDAVNLEFDATAIVDSRGIASGTPVSISHTAVATDGTFVAEGTDLGIVSPDGKYFAIVETDQINDLEMKIGFAID